MPSDCAQENWLCTSFLPPWGRSPICLLPNNRPTTLNIFNILGFVSHFPIAAPRRNATLSDTFRGALLRVVPSDSTQENWLCTSFLPRGAGPRSAYSRASAPKPSIFSTPWALFRIFPSPRFIRIRHFPTLFAVSTARPSKPQQGSLSVQRPPSQDPTIPP
jgi:hypothetical protein